MRSNQPERLRPTAFDMVAAGLSPALIIGMIGSLVFFLVIAFYRGQYDARLMYILGLYTLATVLIARIAIESGRAHANLFAAPLAIVALVAMFRFVTIPGGAAGAGWLLNVGLLGLVWYLADRITFDCTLVEEDRESVQGGLLQTLGMQPRGEAPRPPTGEPVVPLAKTSKHNPGVWVLYFALLAFPLFGLGQLAIPSGPQRSTAFWLLVIYLGCALGLLTTTSLLAMRRYLRQRGVEMPAEITARWLVTGVGIAVALLLVCLLLPLPGRSLGLIGLPFQITSPENLATSRFGMGNDGQQLEQHGVPRPVPNENGEQASQQPANGQAGQGQPRQDENNSAPPPGGAGQQNSQGQQGEQSSQGQQSQPGQSSEQGPRDESGSAGAPSRSRSSSDPQSSARSGDEAPERSSDSSGPSHDKNERSGDRRQTEQNRDETAEQNPGTQPDRSASATKETPRDRAAQEHSEPEHSQKGEPADNTGGKSPSHNISQQLAQFGNWLATWLKWLTIAVLALIVLLYVLFHPSEVAKLWRGLLDFLALLFGRKRVRREEMLVTKDLESAASQRPRFGAFVNPFAQNLQGWHAARVIEHTFAALEAWAAEHGHQRHADQTADEFAKRLAADIPQLVKLPIVAATMLDRVMFAGWQPAIGELAPLSELWRRLQALELLTATNAESAEMRAQ